MIVADLLVIMPYAGTRVQAFFGPLLTAMDESLISTPRRQAAFIAQIAHESGELRYTAEIADGSAYEGRQDLGNTQAGDGPRFKARGLLGLTGRANYAWAQEELHIPCLEHPELLEEPEGACRVSARWWFKHGLNPLADSDKFGSITKVINGGFNGMDSRIAYWLRARTQMRVS